MYFFLLLRKADEMGINFWLRLLALGLCLSLFLLSAYYFLIVNREAAAMSPTTAINLQDTEKRQTDAALSTRIRSAITQTKRLYGHSIGVENKDGIITLSGEVPTEIDKDLAGNLAQGTAGGQEVKNQIRVTPGLKRLGETALQGSATTHVEDLEMEANLRESLQSIAELKAQPIIIKVKERAVTISGRVATAQQRLRVEQTLRNAPKVSRLSNQLRVGAS